MNKMMTAMLATCVLCVAPACTQQDSAQDTAQDTAATDPIEGTWQADLASVQIDEKPSTYLLKDGTYNCSTCIPPLTVKADGAFHPVADRPYYDSMSVTVVNDKTVKTVSRKGDRTINEATMVASPDGSKLTFQFKDSSVPNAPPVTGKGTDIRVAAAPPGAHVISGSWKTDKFESVSDEGLTFSFDVEGDSLRMSSPSGTSYEAKFGGPEVPIKGDTGGTTIAVERLAPNSFRETSKREGKVVNVTTYTVTDGKLNAVSENRRVGSTMKYTAVKQ